MTVHCRKKETEGISKIDTAAKETRLYDIHNVPTQSKPGLKVCSIVTVPACQLAGDPASPTGGCFLCRLIAKRLSGVLLEVGDEVVALLALLETTEGHLGTGNELLGVLEVLEQSVLVPGHTGLLVGIGVGIALDLTGLTAEEAEEVGADLVSTTALDGVALLAASLEELGTLLRVTWRKLLISILFCLRFLQFF